jgi:hypothetical protein
MMPDRIDPQISATLALSRFFDLRNLLRPMNAILGRPNV